MRRLVVLLFALAAFGGAVAALGAAHRPAVSVSIGCYTDAGETGHDVSSPPRPCPKPPKPPVAP